MEDLPEEHCMLGEEASKDSSHSSPAHYHIAPPLRWTCWEEQTGNRREAGLLLDPPPPGPAGLPVKPPS